MRVYVGDTAAREMLQTWADGGNMVDGLRYCFIVSQAVLCTDAEEPSKLPYSESSTLPLLGDVVVGVAHAEGKKCERCWNLSPLVGSDTTHPTLCERCSDVVNNNFSHLFGERAGERVGV